MSSPLQQPGLDSLSKSFEPAALQARWGAEWERRGYGVAGFRGSGAPRAGAAAVSIQLPPPNVTGTLHMGHAFNQTIMDSLTRYHRMRGFNTLWLPGTDHAGIATQIVVERQLQDLGLRRHDLAPTPAEARECFVAKVWEWKQRSGNTITTQMRRLGDSVDWSREYFTMDDKLSKVVTDTFVTLYEQGLIYRGKRLVNWDPQLQSAVSDLEVESEEKDGWLWHIAYPLADGSGRLTVATTRPETMFGDVGLMVAPADARYRSLIGKSVLLPLCERQIPVIADASVDREFGTGVVKVTPAHDQNDYAVGQRHQLPMIVVLTLQASINDNAPAKYRGLDRFVARQAVLADLQACGALVETRAHKLMVPICTRTGQVVEPMLTDQWFVALNKVSSQDPGGQSIAQKALAAVASGAVQFVPENWVNTYDQWLNNIQDWCISRQLWWGHRIPAWYDEDGRVIVARSAAQAQALAPGKTLRRDEDVLDTWYSAALLPFSTMGWPDQGRNASATGDYDLYLPSSVLVTGYDIIFFWVARMIMMTTHFTGRVPFRQVYIHGLVRDAQGKKMSKSEGNVLDPVDLIDGIALQPLLDKRCTGLRRPETIPLVRENTQQEFTAGIPAYGADPLRLTFEVLANLGRSINFDSKRCGGYRNFCTRLRDATRFVLMHCEGQDCGLPRHSQQHSAPDGQPGGPAPDGDLAYSLADRWIISLLQQTEAEVAKGFAEYRLDNVANAIYDLVWNEFCDWYLEIAKVQLHSGGAAERRATPPTLIRTLEAMLRLAHPIIPFITEALWQTVAPVAGLPGESVSIAHYPQARPEKIDPAALAHMDRVKALVAACRTLRGQMNLSPATRLPLYTTGAAEFMRGAAPVLQALAKLSQVQVFDDEAAWATAAQAAPVAVVGPIRICLHMPIDVATEKARLAKEIARIEDAIAKSQAKLGHAAFVAKAPPAVLAQEHQRLADFVAMRGRLSDQLARLG